MQFQKQTTFSCVPKEQKRTKKREHRTQCPTPVFYENLREGLRPLNKNQQPKDDKQA